MAAKKTAKKAAKNVAKKATPAPVETAKPVKKAAAKKATAKSTPVKKAAPSPDELAKAAYLNYRRRVEQGLPGDTNGDWLEAASQLSKDS